MASISVLVSGKNFPLRIKDDMVCLSDLIKMVQGTPKNMERARAKIYKHLPSLVTKKIFFEKTASTEICIPKFRAFRIIMMIGNNSERQDMICDALKFEFDNTERAEKSPKYDVVNAKEDFVFRQQELDFRQKELQLNAIEIKQKAQLLRIDQERLLLEPPPLHSEVRLSDVARSVGIDTKTIDIKHLGEYVANHIIKKHGSNALPQKIARRDRNMKPYSSLAYTTEHVDMITDAMENFKRNGTPPHNTRDIRKIWS